MVRETSIEAYNAIKENGLLSKRRWQVYDILYHRGPLTAYQVAKMIPEARDHSVTPRFSELKYQGVVKEVGESKDSNSGTMVYLWDVTCKLPIPFKRAVFETKKDKIIRLEKELAEAIRDRDFWKNEFQTRSNQPEFPF